MWGPVLELAVKYANADTRMRKLFPVESDIFQPPTDPTKLELWYEPQTVAGQIAVAKRSGELRSEEEIYGELAEIVRDAVKRSLVEYEHGRYFAGIMIAHMREGSLPWQN